MRTIFLATVFTLAFSTTPLIVKGQDDDPCAKFPSPEKEYCQDTDLSTWSVTPPEKCTNFPGYTHMVGYAGSGPGACPDDPQTKRLCNTPLCMCSAYKCMSKDRYERVKIWASHDVGGNSVTYTTSGKAGSGKAGSEEEEGRRELERRRRMIELCS